MHQMPAKTWLGLLAPWAGGWPWNIAIGVASWFCLIVSEGLGVGHDSLLGAGLCTIAVLSFD